MLYKRVKDGAEGADMLLVLASNFIIITQFSRFCLILCKICWGGVFVLGESWYGGTNNVQETRPSIERFVQMPAKAGMTGLWRRDSKGYVCTSPGDCGTLKVGISLIAWRDDC